MDNIVVVLIDKDEKYLIPFEYEFINKFGEKVEIHTITDEDYYEMFFNSLKKIDILIINEEFYNEDIIKHSITSIIVLTENTEIKSMKDVISIYKYTSIKEIFTQIINNPNLNFDKYSKKKTDTEILFVYSPSGGVGKTTVSIGLCAALSRMHRKVLYINTESIQSFGYIMKSKKFCSTEFENKIIEEEEDIIDYINSEIENYQFDYLLPIKHAITSSKIKLSNYKFLINKIKELSRYDYIIVDSTSEFSTEKTNFMAFCNKVILVTLQDKISCDKLSMLTTNIDFSNKSKFIFICNKFNKNKKNWLLEDSHFNNLEIDGEINLFSSDNYNLELLSLNENLQKIAYLII
jgi:cellulose biosynthesis protein BcsQ